jgi:hypothetical protein
MELWCTHNARTTFRQGSQEVQEALQSQNIGKAHSKR